MSVALAMWLMRVRWRRLVKRLLSRLKRGSIAVEISWAFQTGPMLLLSFPWFRA